MLKKGVGFVIGINSNDMQYLLMLSDIYPIHIDGF